MEFDWPHFSDLIFQLKKVEHELQIRLEADRRELVVKLGAKSNVVKNIKTVEEGSGCKGHPKLLERLITLVKLKTGKEKREKTEFAIRNEREGIRHCEGSHRRLKENNEILQV